VLGFLPILFMDELFILTQISNSCRIRSVDRKPAYLAASVRHAIRAAQERSRTRRRGGGEPNASGKLSSECAPDDREVLRIKR
jgi:hypothetical protein